MTEAAYGEGEGVIANSSYETVAHVKAGNGLQADIHELLVDPDGTAWVDTLQPVCLPVCDESHPPVLDAGVQELDIHTGLVMWEWNALGHIPTAESEVAPANGVWDPYHINSIQTLPGDRVLISLRDTSGVYLLDQDTGAIVWQIAGKSSSFPRGRKTRFYFQHDARLEGSHLERLSLFDDEAGPPVYGPSRGLLLSIHGGKVALLHQYPRATTVAPAEGSMQELAHGYALVGYGATPYFSEFTRGGEPEHKGKMVFDAELPKGDGSYRVMREGWVGTPHSQPKLVAERESPDAVSLYASWNGATALAKWEVLAGPSAESLSPVGTFPWSGFETQMAVTSEQPVFEVRALDAGGHVLASSAPVSAP